MSDQQSLPISKYRKILSNTYWILVAVCIVIIVIELFTGSQSIPVCKALYCGIVFPLGFPAILTGLLAIFLQLSSVIDKNPEEKTVAWINRAGFPFRLMQISIALLIPIIGETLYFFHMDYGMYMAFLGGIIFLILFLVITFLITYLLKRSSRPKKVYWKIIAFIGSLILMTIFSIIKTTLYHSSIVMNLIDYQSW